MVIAEDNTNKRIFTARACSYLKKSQNAQSCTRRSLASICKFLPQIETKPIECVLDEEVNL